MEIIGYKHTVEYDSTANKIVIFRLLESGERHLYTEIPLDELDENRRNFKHIGQILGEALLLDMADVRDRIP